MQENQEKSLMIIVDIEHNNVNHHNLQQWRESQ